MRLNFKHFSRAAVALAMFATAAIAGEVSPEKMVDVPLKDMRGESAEAVQKRALKDTRDGIVLVYSGETAQLQQVVRDIAGECAARGFQVKSVVLADQAHGAGVTMYGQDGGPLGPKVEFSGDMKRQTGEQIERLKQRLAQAAAANAAIDPMDVVHCKYIATTGSLVRKTKVCSTPREDAEREKAAREWTRDRQNKGGNEAMPNPG
jgi:hypothetical protein